MKTVWQDFCKYTVEFKLNFWKYNLLFIGIELLNVLVLIPIFKIFNSFFLQKFAIQFTSYQNFLTIVSRHLNFFIIFLIMITLMLLILYVQFVFLLLGVQAIKENNFNLKIIFLEAMHSIKKMQLSTFLLFFLSGLFFTSITGLVFRLTSIAKISILEFLLDFLTRNEILLMISIVVLIILFLVIVKLIFVFPLIIFEKKSSSDAIKISWHLTNKNRLQAIINKIFFLLAISIIITLSTYFSIYLLQLVYDQMFSYRSSQIFAIIMLFIGQLVSEITLVWSIVLGVSLLINRLNTTDIVVERKNKQNTSKTIVLGALIVFMVFGTKNIIDNYLYIYGHSLESTKIISHRGVSQKNGVQNTIGALNRTSKLKPDFVEIDLHETKDNQFVVMHDENLKKLSHTTKKPKQLTLNQLENLTVKENGYREKISSFDNYLRESEKNKQRLLIEIKTTPTDSKGMLKRFNKKYGSLIVNRKYEVHSLDYNVVQKLKKMNPKIYTIWILSYNFIYPQSAADGYSVRYSAVSDDFIWQAHSQNKKVYVWTIENKHQIQKMLYEHVDGIITDNVSETQTLIKKFQKENNLASQILNYIW